MAEIQLPAVILRKNKDRRLRAGHLWVYSNEVDTRKTPLSGFEPGSTVVIQTSTGKPIGCGYINPHSLICARLLTRQPASVFDTAFFVKRIETALELRAALFDSPHYRLVYGEGDDLPGLVVDRYADILVVQITTAGMERCKAAILEALQQVMKPRGILLRNDSPVRKLEQLELYTETIGEVSARVTLEEGGTRFELPLGEGQKTGWFFDQRSNRLAMHKYVRGRRVLDVFSYVGAWGVQAARAGAADVSCVDTSALAQELLMRNAATNGVNGNVHLEAGEAFEVLKEMRAAHRRFGVVIVDPPAFIKRRKDIRNGEQAYHRLNQQAMQLLEPGGFLISSSCSMHLSAERLQDILQQSAHHLGRRLQVVERGFQAMDHPVHPAIPETAYLKTLFCRLLPA